MHIVLLGDSIFDNASYVSGGPAVIDHLRRRSPSGAQATLLARDGAMVGDVARQMEGVPLDASHLVLSVGGNDALEHHGLIRHEPAESFAEVLTRLGAIQDQFERDYRALLQMVASREVPTFVCTVYDAVPGLERSETAALCLFNDAILRSAFRFGVAVVDLRLVCTEAADYAEISPIEPSATGGAKIASAILRAFESEVSGATSRVSW